MQTTLPPEHAIMERNALFSAALQLISEGKFFRSTLEEIAFHARISGATVAYIFQSKETLSTDLVETVIDKISLIIDREVDSAATFKDGFFNLWYSLFTFYAENPHVIALLEQYKNVSSVTRRKHPSVSGGLVDFFDVPDRPAAPNLNAETLAFLYHENIITAVKMKLTHLSVADDLEVSKLPQLFWQSLTVTDTGD